MIAHQKWTKYFETSKNEECHSELLKIVQFFFAIPSRNANVERVFSLMQAQWTKERNSLSVDSLRGILLVQYNFRHISCKDIYPLIKSSPKLLEKIRTAKYSRSHEEED